VGTHVIDLYPLLKIKNNMPFHARPVKKTAKYHKPLKNFKSHLYQNSIRFNFVILIYTLVYTWESSLDTEHTSQLFNIDTTLVKVFTPVKNWQHKATTQSQTMMIKQP
jgi:hypothetical protein